MRIKLLKIVFKFIKEILINSKCVKISTGRVEKLFFKKLRKTIFSPCRIKKISCKFLKFKFLKEDQEKFHVKSNYYLNFPAQKGKLCLVFG